MDEIKALLIIAAGEGSRMGHLPKAVSLVKGTPNLYHTVSLADEYFDKIYVFTLEKYKGLFEEVLENFSDKCSVIDIKSGYGCGDAVRTSTEAVYDKLGTNFVMMWGDVYVPNGKIFEELLMYPTASPLLIPVVEEDDPYVWFSKDHFNIVNAAMFKKRDEVIGRGFHDQSIFKLKKQKIKNVLDMMWTVNKKLNSYLNSELIFLDSVHVLFNLDTPAEIYTTQYETMGYNTHGELLDINNKILGKNV